MRWDERLKEPLLLGTHATQHNDGPAGFAPSTASPLQKSLPLPSSATIRAPACSRTRSFEPVCVRPPPKSSRRRPQRCGWRNCTLFGGAGYDTLEGGIADAYPPTLRARIEADTIALDLRAYPAAPTPGLRRSLSLFGSRPPASRGAWLRPVIPPQLRQPSNP